MSLRDAAGASKMYWEQEELGNKLETRGRVYSWDEPKRIVIRALDWDRPARKADHPMVSSSQCFFCKRGIQDGEEVIRDGGNVAHAECVMFLVKLINANRPVEGEQKPEVQKSIPGGVCKATPEQHAGSTAYWKGYTSILTMAVIAGAS